MNQNITDSECFVCYVDYTGNTFIVFNQREHYRCEVQSLICHFVTENILLLVLCCAVLSCLVLSCIVLCCVLLPSLVLSCLASFLLFNH